MDTHHRIQLLERRVKVCFIVVPRNGAVSGMILLVLEEKAQAVFQQPPATR